MVDHGGQKKCMNGVLAGVQSIDLLVDRQAVVPSDCC